jgi:hypothetical protein
MIWSIEKPTTVGLYWYREIVNSVKIPTIVQVVSYSPDGMGRPLQARKLADATIYHLRELRGEWAGPLVSPEG